MTHYDKNLNNNPTTADLLMAINTIQLIAETMVSDDGQANTDFVNRFAHRHDITKNDYIELLADIAITISSFHRKPGKAVVCDDLPFVF